MVEVEPEPGAPDGADGAGGVVASSERRGAFSMLGDGSCLLLDDEEGAGDCGRPDIEPQDWCLAVTMTVNVEAVKSALKCHRQR
jgi:hypothetical protein